MNFTHPTHHLLLLQYISHIIMEEIYDYVFIKNNATN